MNAIVFKYRSRELNHQELYESIAKPFEWKFTRADLNRILSKVTICIPEKKQAAA